jgi:hypothetical protein
MSGLASHVPWGQAIPKHSLRQDPPRQLKAPIQVPLSADETGRNFAALRDGTKVLG